MSEPSNSDEKLRVFLCHASGDKSRVRRVYELLLIEGFQPWLDEEDLIPGQKWEVEIPLEVRRSHIVVVCLSNESLTKVGYVQKEIKYALDVADEHPDATVFIVPLRLEECEIPQRLKHLHSVNYYKYDGQKRLLKALGNRAQSLGIEIKALKRHPFRVCVATIATERMMLIECDLTLDFDPEKKRAWQFELKLRNRPANELLVTLQVPIGTAVANGLAENGMSEKQFNLLCEPIAEGMEALAKGVTKKKKEQVANLVTQMLVMF